MAMIWIVLIALVLICLLLVGIVTIKTILNKGEAALSRLDDDEIPYLTKINKILEDTTFVQLVEILGVPDKNAGGLRPVWKVNGSPFNKITVYYTDNRIVKIRWLKIGSFLYEDTFADSYFFSGPGVGDDQERLKDIWGVTIPGENSTLIKHFDDLIEYLVGNDNLDKIQAQIQRDWGTIHPNKVIEHINYTITGKSDPNMKISEWITQDGKMLTVCLDYSTGIAHFLIMND